MFRRGMLKGTGPAGANQICLMGAQAGQLPQRATLTALVAGLMLAVPPVSEAHGRYSVQWGDTLTGIAAQHDTSIHKLIHVNGLAPGQPLLAGTTLRMPDRTAVRKPRRHDAHGSPIREGIDFWAARYGIDVRLAHALAWMESGYQPHVTSWAGAWGVMQVTPDAWLFVEYVLVGRPVARTPNGNIRVGVAYLHYLLHFFGGDERLALGSYYQGARSVRLHGLFGETRAYVADIIALKMRV